MITDIFRSAEQARQAAGNTAVAIGNFDGVHIGHRALIETTRAHAARNGLVTTALTFYPHPACVVAPERAPQLITTLERRIELLGQAGAKRVFVLPFTSEIADLAPDDFVREYLVSVLKARAVFVGQNFRFGKKQAGTPEVLNDLGVAFGFQTFFLPPVLWRKELVSSTGVRRAISAGDVSKAGRLLGRCHSIEGKVVSGHGIGSKQTVPTLNLHAPELLVIPRGVYTTETEDLESKAVWRSITNCGVRPTFGGEELTVETFLLDPLTSSSPTRIRVSFRRFVRAEKQFPSPEALRAQILKDVGRAQKYWQHWTALAGTLPSVY